MIGVTILGSTGSVGTNTLNVIAAHRGRFKVVALTAFQRVDVLYEQCLEFEPQYVVVLKEEAAQQLQARLKAAKVKTEVLIGTQALIEVASMSETDYIVAAIVGAAGLMPTLAAAKAGKRILLANKEALVMSGQLFMNAIRQNHATLLPVDSEHNAIFQSMPADFLPGMPCPEGITRIILTASGGPFRTYSPEELEHVTPEQACAHPIWNMGSKISVDSATMMNKGLEVIEAYWLFGISSEQIEVLLHPQSIIHSLVEYQDGSLIAQLGNPDMRTPIAHTLAWPGRMESNVKRLNLAEIGKLEFEAISFIRYPCLKLAYDVLKAGGTASVILNAANEIAVDAFLRSQIRFTQIAEIVDSIMQETPIQNISSIEQVLAEDHHARIKAKELIANMATSMSD